MKVCSFVVVLLVAVCGDVNGQIISPYQVAIRLYDNFLPSGAGGNINLCNGAVIHERFILTTADCMHARILSANISRPYLPSMFYVAAGTFQSNPTNTRYPEAIFVHENYNPYTLENDIALVKLNEPFPLRNNPAIQWIELDNTNGKYENCFTSFLNQTSPDYPYTSPQATYIMDNWFCNRNLNATNSAVRNNDICSHYILNDSSMCEQKPSQFQLSSDRGTPLVCNNHLSGLLSQVLPPENITNPLASCQSTLRTWAFYTKLSSYTQWIHQTIAKHQPIPDPGQNPQPPTVTSPPYYTPPAVHPQQPPVVPGQKPGKNSGNRLTNSSKYILLFSCFNLILTFCFNSN